MTSLLLLSLGCGMEEDWMLEWCSVIMTPRHWSIKGVKMTSNVTFVQALR